MRRKKNQRKRSKANLKNQEAAYLYMKPGRLAVKDAGLWPSLHPLLSDTDISRQSKTIMARF